MTSLKDMLFGPLNVEYCMYFYIMSAFGLLCFILVLINMLIAMSGSKQPYIVLLAGLYFSLWWLFFYLENRLLYSMCLNSENKTPSYKM
jgi:hypothetical protein